MLLKGYFYQRMQILAVAIYLLNTFVYMQYYSCTENKCTEVAQCCHSQCTVYYIGTLSFDV